MLADLYREMLRIRRFEDAVHRLFLQNEVPGTTHLCQGQEAVVVGAAAALKRGDTVAATYRGHGALLAMGSDAFGLLAELLGKEAGLCGGRAGSMNVVDLAHGVIGCFGIVGGSIGAGTGAALAAQLSRDGSVAVSFFGDGAVNQAYFHECLNFAAVRKLPIVYVCENNLYGEWTRMEHVTAGPGIAQRGAAYGLPFDTIDGNDVLVVRAAVERAVTRARAGEGPTLLECLTYRHKGHSRADPGKYRPPEEVEAWLKKDPLPRAEAGLEQAEVERIRSEVEQELAEVVARARAAPLPKALGEAYR